MLHSIARFFCYLSQFILSLFLCLIGLLTLMIPWSVVLRTNLVDFLFEDTLILSVIGIFLILIGAGLFTRLYFHAQKQSYYIKVNQGHVDVDEKVLQKYLETYWQKLFPGESVNSQIIVRRNKIKVFAELPAVSIEKRAALVEKIKKEIGDIFSSVLGHTQEFVINLSFTE